MLIFIGHMQNETQGTRDTVNMLRLGTQFSFAALENTSATLQFFLFFAWKRKL